MTITKKKKVQSLSGVPSFPGLHWCEPCFKRDMLEKTRCRFLVNTLRTWSCIAMPSETRSENKTKKYKKQSFALVNHWLQHLLLK